MKKIFNLKNKEKKIYNFWLKNKFFNPNLNINKKNFSIIMPPPNITGNLHIGHAYQQTLMDIIIRYKKISGYNTFWIMGTDHAGIATQIIVENYLKKKNINVSKNEIINKLWKWKIKYEKKINEQTKLLGNSIYWKKTRFSLDKNFSYSVNKAFINLYKKKLIYRSNKIIYWDKKIKTVLSDLEIKKKNKKIKRYYIKYFILNDINNNYLIAPTTNPETILGNVALAINPNIKKYKKLINNYAINPINNYKLKIISDKSIKKNKYFGCIKITPSHNNKNLKLSKKYKLNIINFLNDDGTLKQKPNIFKYNGKKIINKKIFYKNKLNKKKIINILKKKKHIFKTEICNKNISFSTKTNSKIIKILKKQWFLKTKKISKKSIKIIKKNKITIKPSKYKNLFFYWMKNNKDWCLSRQIYWGHRLPVWYDKKNKNNIYVGYNKKYIIKKYKLININLKQDKDVLDTWFSSSIWTFASLGWPKKTKIFKLFHPINLVISGFDIIYYWIARMIMLTICLIKKKKIYQIPFKKVFITGLITDENGKKMSKSIGNVINPKDIIYGITLKKLIKKRTKNLLNYNNIKTIKENTKKNFPEGIKKYGVDVLRLALTSISNNNLKINFNIKQLEINYNFCNKLWNLSIFIIKFIQNKKKSIKKNNNLLLIDNWILYKFNKFLKNYKNYIKNFQFNILCIKIKKFVKNYLCDWYIEFIKIFNFYNRINYSTIKTLKFIFFNILKLLHPIIPFITEYIFKKINFVLKKKTKSILLTKIPKIINKFNNKILIKSIKIIKYIIIFIRKTNNNKKIILIILNIPLVYKKIILDYKFIFKKFNIDNIFFTVKKYFNKINNKNYSEPKLLNKKLKNFYILYKNKNTK